MYVLLSAYIYRKLFLLNINVNKEWGFFSNSFKYRQGCIVRKKLRV